MERGMVIAFTILVKAFRNHTIFRGLISLFFLIATDMGLRYRDYVSHPRSNIILV